MPIGMSDEGGSEASYSLEGGGRVVRIETGTSRTDIPELHRSLEETLRRLSTNFMPRRSTGEFNDGNLGCDTFFAI